MMRTRAAILLGIAALGLAGCADGVAPVKQPPTPTPLAVFGHSSVLEFGPVLWTAKHMPEGAVVTASGGVPNLWNAPDPQLGASVGGHSSGSPPPVNNGLADLAGNAETQVLRMSLRYPDVRIILTVTEGLYRVVARRSSGIASLQDLKGKRIAVFANTSAAFYLHKILKHAGLSEADVTVVPLTAGAGARAVIAGEVDALATWEPESERAAIALGENGISFHPPVYREIYNLNARASTLADPVKRRQVVAFVRQLFAGCRAARENPADMQAMLAERTGHDVGLIRASWVHHRFPCSLPSDLLDVMVEEEKWLAAAQGRTARERGELAQYIDDSILKEALESVKK